MGFVQGVPPAGLDWRWVGLAVLSLPLIYFVYTAIYNVFFHPLKNYPGPFWNKVTRIPYALMLYRGRSSQEVRALHEKYGSVVRLAPTELAFGDSQAWQDIMGHRKGSQVENEKEVRYVDNQFGSPDIIFSNRDDHRRFRRILSHNFSNQAMFEQQPLIMRYVNKLISQLYDRARAGGVPVDLVAWYNFTTFDIIADLTFGESMGLLDKGQYNLWVSSIFGSIKMGTLIQIPAFFPPMQSIVKKLMPASVMRKRNDHARFTVDRINARLDSGIDRPDFMHGIETHKEKETGGMSRKEIHSNGSLLMIAGSETTATTLSGATYLCLTHPHVLAKVTEEVRSTFASDSEIDLHSVTKLDYMLAMLEEAMRLYPPVPTTVGRVTPPGGNVICGRFVPEKTTLTIWQLAMFHDPNHFKHADRFIPERWLGDDEFKDDVREAFQPFHFGPRSCLGRNLAYAEMRVIFAKMVYNFDMRLDPGSARWMDQKMFTLWDKPPLKVHLTPAKGREAVSALA